METIEKRLRAELYKEGKRLIELKVKDIDEEEQETIEKVKEFMEKNTDKTEKHTDVLGTTELHEKYLNWNQKVNHEKNPEIAKVNCGSINYIDTNREFGKYLSDLGYIKGKAKREGKTVRGYSNVKYKESADTSISVKEYMEKYTERTDSVKDRVVISKLLPKFYKEYRERYGEVTFKNKLLKYGYHTKVAKETQIVEGRYGKEKYVKVGVEVPCVLKVRLKNEFYRDEWTQ